jgi:Aspartyl-tRNA synthetase
MKNEQAQIITIDSLGDWKRTHGCGTLRQNHVDRDIILMGWVNRRRDLGNLIFIDLRDREGITQVVFDPQVNTTAHERAHILRNEWVLAVKGTVVPDLKAGKTGISPPDKLK